MPAPLLLRCCLLVWSAVCVWRCVALAKARTHWRTLHRPAEELLHTGAGRKLLSTERLAVWRGVVAHAEAEECHLLALAWSCARLASIVFVGAVR